MAIKTPFSVVIGASLLIAFAPNVAFATWFDSSGESAGAYLCIPETASGIIWSEIQKKWHGDGLDLGDKKFLLELGKRRVEKRGDPQENAIEYSVRVKSAGLDKSLECYGDEGTGAGIFLLTWKKEFQCKAGVAQYFFNLDTNTYIRFERGGYLDGGIVDRSSIVLEAGKCTKID